MPKEKIESLERHCADMEGAAASSQAATRELRLQLNDSVQERETLESGLKVRDGKESVSLWSFEISYHR